MRISDWSSDVCSSDLRPQNGADILGACRRPRRATEVGTLPASCPRAPGVASARGRRLEIGTGPAKRTTGEQRGRMSGAIPPLFIPRGVWLTWGVAPAPYRAWGPHPRGGGGQGG